MKADWFQRIGYFGLLGFVSALQFSIAAANIFLGLSLLMWLMQAIADAPHRRAAILLSARGVRGADAASRRHSRTTRTRASSTRSSSCCFSSCRWSTSWRAARRRRSSCR